ncbi:MAG TPA: hypothetical protein DIW34_05015, partial [Oribacterium sp.]|nr:hypothetical protein [Oribacterium sp.]
PASVELAASTYIIDGMTVFELPKIDISGATGTKTVSFDLTQYLPAGVELADGQDAEVNVTVRIEKIPETEALSESDGNTDASSASSTTQSGSHDAESETNAPESSAEESSTEAGAATHETSSTHEETLLSQGTH